MTTQQSDIIKAKKHIEKLNKLKIHPAGESPLIEQVITMRYIRWNKVYKIWQIASEYES
jgi:hypothetical protein